MTLEQLHQSRHRLVDLILKMSEQPVIDLDTYRRLHESLGEVCFEIRQIENPLSLVEVR